jgi:hypothetical protein
MKLLYGLVCQLVATYAVVQTIALLWSRDTRPENVKTH